MNDTLEYYDQNAVAFADGTMNVDFSEIQNMFLLMMDTI